MKRDWILVNVLINFVGIIAILLSLSSYEEKDFLFESSVIKEFDDKIVTKEGIEVSRYIVEVKAAIPSYAFNLSAFNVTNALALPQGGTAWKLNIAMNRFPDNSIKSGVAMQEATIFDSLFLDRRINMELPRTLEKADASPIDFLEEARIQKVFFELVIFGRFLYLALVLSVFLAAVNLGVWFYLRLRRKRDQQRQLIEKAERFIESEPFQEMMKLLSDAHPHFNENELKIAVNIRQAGNFFSEFMAKKRKPDDLERLLLEIEFDRLPPLVRRINKEIKLRIARNEADEQRRISEEAGRQKMMEKFNADYSELVTRLVRFAGLSLAKDKLGIAYDRARKDLVRVANDYFKDKVNQNDLIDAAEQIAILEESSKAKV